MVLLLCLEEIFHWRNKMLKKKSENNKNYKNKTKAAVMFKVKANSLKKIITKMNRIMKSGLIIKNNKSHFQKDRRSILLEE